MEVSPVFSNVYRQWRLQNETRLLLREQDGPQPPERLLQAIWHHQRLLREKLQTLDGQNVRILHPGFWNREAGPDFRGAVIQFGSDKPRTGDVEIDLAAGGWRGHGHDRNPNFGNVILHVVWNADPGPAGNIPAIAMENVLDAPLPELKSWIGSDAATGWPEELRGHCCAPLRDLSAEKTAEILRQAAQIRFERKAHELEARARRAGWEQALWEGLFRALGYKQNVWPLQRIGELLPQLSANEGSSVYEWQARLLGVSGLLPNEISHRSGEYLRKIWDQWWRERDRFADVVLPKTLWRLNGLRPANQPQRRLAVAAHWLASRDLPAKLECWFTQQKSSRLTPSSLLECFQGAADEFWSCHWSLTGVRLSKAQPLLGATRVTDLAVNVILPWFWVRARVGKNPALQKLAEDLYFAWPPAQDNSLLRLARQRLLGVKTSRLLNSASAQQGLLQIVRDFCDHSNALCADCLFPDLVRQFKPQA
jgi:hypothetical protein